LYETLNYMLQALKFSSVIELYEFLKRCLIEVVYNTILTIILYPIWKKAGPYIEEKLKPNNVARYL